MEPKKKIFAIGNKIINGSGGGSIGSGVIDIDYNELIQMSDIDREGKTFSTFNDPADKSQEEIDLIKLVLGMITSLDTLSWGFIDFITRQGLTTSFFKVGDEKKITLLNGEVITLVILGFKHDDLTGGGKAEITFGMKNLITTPLSMNSTNTNVGGWGSSAMRTDTMPTLLSNLPVDLRAIIKSVNKKTSIGNLNSTINITSDNLFLLSEIELKGAITHSFIGEGNQYAYYQGKSGTDFIKYLSDGAGAISIYHLRSPYNGSETSFCGTALTGNSYYYTASSTRGVSFCFCI